MGRRTRAPFIGQVLICIFKSLRSEEISGPQQLRINIAASFSGRFIIFLIVGGKVSRRQTIKLGVEVFVSFGKVLFLSGVAKKTWFEVFVALGLYHVTRCLISSNKILNIYNIIVSIAPIGFDVNIGKNMV